MEGDTMTSEDICGCGHPRRMHAERVAPRPGTRSEPVCVGKLGDMDDGDLVATMVAAGADPDERCLCTRFEQADA